MTKSKKEQTVEHITETAKNLFSKNGFRNTTVRMIAKEADCAEGLIHKYFGGKEGLLNHVMKSSIGASKQKINKHTEDLPSSCTYVKNVITEGVSRMLESEDLLRICVGQSLVDEQFALSFQESRSKIETDIKKKLSVLKKEGKLKEEVDINALATLISCTVWGLGFCGNSIFYWQRSWFRF